MHKRYILAPMKKLWSEESQFSSWLMVELAVLCAKNQLGQLSDQALKAIQENASFSIDRIEAFEAEYRHDVIAFVKSVQETLVLAGAGQYKEELHLGLTSADTTDPALIWRLRQANQLIISELIQLQNALWQLAQHHKQTLMIADTHGQYAEPASFGHLLLVFAEAVNRGLEKLRNIQSTDLKFGKISGAVGTYGGMDPKVEALALTSFGLLPATAETQILQRDRHARFLNEIAVIGSTIEQMMATLWQKMRSDVRQLEEPRGKAQRGSTAMAHKKNPITTEQLRGLSRLLRGNSLAAMENIATPGFRDISQSSVERVILPDSTTLLHYMASKATYIISKMKVFPERMLVELEKKTLGVWASQPIRNALMKAGVPYDPAYEYAQRVSFMATDLNIHLREVLAKETISDTDPRTAVEILGGDQVERAFDAWAYIKDGTELIFRRVRKALPEDYLK